MATATTNPDGDAGYVINGVKTWCTFAGRANALMLLEDRAGDPGGNLHKDLLWLAHGPGSPAGVQ